MRTFESEYCLPGIDITADIVRLVNWRLMQDTYLPISQPLVYHMNVSSIHPYQSLSVSIFALIVTFTTSRLLVSIVDLHSSASDSTCWGPGNDGMDDISGADQNSVTG